MPRFKETLHVGGEVAPATSPTPTEATPAEPASPRKRQVHATDKLVTVEDISNARKVAKGV